VTGEELYDRYAPAPNTVGGIVGRMAFFAATHDSTELYDVGQRFVSEMTKSYGLRYENRQWSWSVENAAKSFKEEPVWTTIDWALTALPVAKWGSAMARVSKGTGAAGRAYKAGAVAGEFGSATTRGGRFTDTVGRAFGASEGFGRAYELERAHGVAQTPVGRFFSSYAARRSDDPEWERLVNAAGGRDPNEMRAWGAMLERDRRAEAAAYAIEGENLAARWKEAGVHTRTPDATRAGEIAHRSLSLGHSQADARVAAIVGKDVDDVYQASSSFRRKVHDGWNEAGFTSDEVWEAGNDGYMPRVHREWERVKAEFPETFGPTVNAAEQSGARRGMHRKWSASDIDRMESEGVLHRILDPGVGMVEIGRAGMALAGHNYVKRLANSAAVRSADEVLGEVSHLFNSDPTDLMSAAKRAQYTDKQAEAFRGWERMYRSQQRAIVGGTNDPKILNYENVDPKFVTTADQAEAFKTLDDLSLLPDEVKASMLRRLGWKPLEEVLTAGKDMPGHLSKIADDFRGKWVDPAAIEDFAGVKKVVGVFEGLPAWMQKTVGTFKYTHTVLNPATQVRNKVGSWIMHHLSVGGLGIFDPNNPFMRRGAQALHYGAKGEGDEIAKQDWADVLRTGFVNSGQSAEVTREWQRAIGTQIQAGNGVGEEMFYRFLDWMPGMSREGKTAEAVGGFMGKMTRMYQYTDDLAKADAFLTLRDRHLKALNAERADLLSKQTAVAIPGQGGSRVPPLLKMTPEQIREEAIGRAMVEVAKFQPMFSQVSPFTNAIRDAVPFSGFTTEAVRVWKNAIVDRPVLTFMYNNLIEAASHVTGAMAGFDEKQLADAEASLPWYMQGKKALTMPFRVDGKPVFVDFSYMIPMANLPESFSAESSFFDWIQIDPWKSNPLLGIGTAIATGRDSFTDRPIEPTFTDRFIGTVDPALAGGQVRKIVGLAEYTARQLLPPLAPPGFAGVNMLELLTGKKNGFTGQELEQGVARTVASNFLGLRSYQGGVNSQLQNAKREDAKLDERMSVWWGKWKDAAANGDAAGMHKAISEVSALRKLRGDDEAAVGKYIAQGIKEREPGKFRGLSTRELQTTLDRANRLGGLSDEDKAIRAELMARLQERANRGRGKKKTPKKKAEEKVK
jgi:hypothetical protein